VLRSMPPRSFESEDTRRDRKACVEAKQGCGRWAFVRCRKSEDLRGWMAANSWNLLTVYICIKLNMDLQANKSPVVVKGPFFP
jgi:hypothetical protein